MAEHPIQGLMRTTMTSIKEMVDVNTVVGDPVETQDGAVIIPVSRVSFGFGAGGADWGGQSGDGEEGGTSPFGGGSGAGIAVSPVGFLVVNGEQVRFLSVQNGAATLDRLVDAAPGLLERLQSLVRRGEANVRADPGPGSLTV